MSALRRNSYTFREGLAMMAAKAVGIDPDLAVEAGDKANAAMNFIRNAMKANSPKARAEHVTQAQQALRSISPSKHPELVNALQAKLLALQGRRGDTEVVHVTPGEVVVPRNMQTPAVMRTLAAEAARAGIDPRRYTVGHPANSVNPWTGAGEFQSDFKPDGYYQGPDGVWYLHLNIYGTRPDTNVGNGSGSGGGQGNGSNGGGQGNGNGQGSGTGVAPSGTLPRPRLSGNGNQNFGPRQTDWINPYDPFGVFSRFQPQGRSPFGRGAFMGSQDMYFNDHIQRTFEGLTPEKIEIRYGGQRQNSDGPQTPLNLIPSTELKNFLSHVEGRKDTCYDSKDGFITCGIGSNIGKIDGPARELLGHKLSDDQIDDRYEYDSGNAMALVRTYVKVPLTQHQFDALTSFAFNLGTKAFLQDEKDKDGNLVLDSNGNPKKIPTTILNYINAGDHENAAKEFGRWVYSNGVILDGLVKRRKAEELYYLYGPDAALSHLGN
ncbi:MAG: lysozyme [Rhodospirillaceae bacterium]|nr:lysozyme [Rhodospirillaceae bacterium]